MQLAGRNVNKMLELIQEILDISQLESGQLPLEKAPVFLHTLIPDILLLQRPITEMKSLQLKSEVTDTLPAAWADDRIIRRVLQNLVDNAAKFSRRQGTIIVSAKVLQDEDQTARLQISVSDEGLGIPAELRNHIFDKFVSGQHKRRGSGLGLTFCRLAIQAHHGQIWVESEAGLGSTFHFTLPLAPL
jgi:signal transduction histidine kinase